MIRHGLFISIVIISGQLIASEIDERLATEHLPTARKNSDTSINSESTAMSEPGGGAGAASGECSSSEEDIEIDAVINMAKIFINRHHKKSSELRINPSASTEELINLYDLLEESKRVTAVKKQYLIDTLRCTETAAIRDSLVDQLAHIIQSYTSSMELIAAEIKIKDSTAGVSLFYHLAGELHSQEALDLYLHKGKFFLKFHHQEAEQQIQEMGDLFKYYGHKKTKLFRLQENLEMYRDIVIDKCTPIEAALNHRSENHITNPEVRQELVIFHTKLRHIIAAYNASIAALKSLAR